MIPFRTSLGAIFRCEADFSSWWALNLDFYDSAGKSILFHVSVRRDENLIVINRRSAAGWHREIRFPRVFQRRPVSVEITFARGRVIVSVGGEKVGRFDGMPRFDRAGRFFLRRGFKDLRKIAFVDIEGPMVHESLEIESPAFAIAYTGIPRLNDSLEVVLQGMTEDSLPKGCKPVLQIEGFESDIPAVLRPLVYLLPQDPQRRRAHELAAIVPGRVWDAGLDRLAMTFTDGAGGVLAQITVSREDLAARIGGLADSGGLDLNDRAALLAIEHARHAGLLPLLTQDQMRVLLAVADRFRLARYLLDAAPEPEVLTRDLPSLTVDDQGQRVEALRNHVMQTLRDAPQTDAIALLRSGIAENALRPEAIVTLLTAMTEWFCLNGGMSDLARLWRDLNLPGLTAPEAEQDAWTTSALLPFYYAQGQFDAVALALRQLALVSTGWVLTPNIGWVLQETARNAPDIDGRLASSAQKEAIVLNAVIWLKARAGQYWERTPCRCVIAGMVALLSRAEILSPHRADALQGALLRTYALTPSFWEAVDQSLDAHRWTLTLELQHARAAFDELRARLESGATTTPEARRETETLLHRFHKWRVKGRQHYGRALLGPAGESHEPGALPGFEACRQTGIDANEAALRYLAHPSITRPDGPPTAAISAAAAQGLIAAHQVVEHSPQYAAQVLLFKQAPVLLERPDKVVLQDVISAMETTASAPARYLGIGIGLILANLLLSQNREAEAETLVRRVVDLVAALPEDWMRQELIFAPAPDLAMLRLREAHPDHPLTGLAQEALGPSTHADLLHPKAEPRKPDTNPMLDTVVCLYTCRANLHTRVAVIRAGWMRLLADIGVPCLIFVGGGEGERNGDIVSLDAPDDYEGLPQKTLAMVRWVFENTRYSYMVKVDDDCFLDPQAYFSDLAYQKHNYYGRPLIRHRGNMDRTWHMAKSSHPRGRLELDKSPEPSVYADGGSGYTLSRRAMEVLCKIAETPLGQELIHTSFMEDKLTGDLLKMGGIPVSGEDYRIAVLRRTKPGGPLVPAWQNGFLPFAGSGVKLAHLDGHEKQDEVLAGSRTPWPQAYKVWPSFQPVQLGWNSNTLDLISTPEKLAAVNTAPVAVVACLRNEMFMLPQFLAHYRTLGVQGFLIADNGSDDGSFEYLDAQPDVALFAVDTEYRLSHYGVAWQQALISNFRVGRWSLAADADEFLFWNAARTGSLPDLVMDLDAEGADAARIFMLDMYPQGSLAGADFKTADPFAQAGFVDRDPFLTTSGARGPFSNSRIWTSALRHRLIPGSRAELFVAQKYALLKYQPWMRLSAGLHFVADIKPSHRELLFAHFKYNAAFRAKAETEVARQQHFNDAEEYRKYLALISEGRDVVFDPEISVRWDRCAFVRARLTD